MISIGGGCFPKAIRRLKIDGDELPPASGVLFDAVFPEAVEKVHDTGDSLRVRALALLSDHPLDRARVDDEASRYLLGVISNVFSNESRTLLVGGEFAFGKVLR